MLVVTTNDLPGRTIVRHIGLARGVTVRSRNVIANIGGGTAVAFRRQPLCLYRTGRAGAQGGLRALVRHAVSLGANAVIAMRYDANEIMDGITEVLAYGTAVAVEPALE